MESAGLTLVVKGANFGLLNGTNILGNVLGLQINAIPENP